MSERYEKVRTAPLPRPIAEGGDPYGTHRGLVPKGALPQPAERVDNDFTRLFFGEALVAVDTLNIDAASFRQMEEASRAARQGAARGVARIVLRTVRDRGKQHNPVTGSGGMLLGRVLQRAPGRSDALAEGDRIATLVSLTGTPLRIDRVRSVRRESAQIDVEGEAVLFASGPYARLPPDMPERLALAVLDVAGAAPQVARRVEPGHVVVVLGAGGKSGVLCAAQARRSGREGGDVRATERAVRSSTARSAGPAFVVGVESRTEAADELRALGLCDAIVTVDARDPVAVRRIVLEATGGREADVTFSCVNVPDAEMAAILVTRARGTAYFFAMSTSFTKAALGAESVGKDVDLIIGNGYAEGHAEHTLALLRDSPGIRALFERRYAT